MYRFISFVFLVAGILPPALAELGIAYDDVTSCSSSVVEMNSLSFDCDQSTGCTLGDEVTITGQFTSTIAIPGEVNIKIQICKFWGTLCTSYLADQDIDICGLFSNDDSDEGSDDDVYCASAGTHDFQTSLALPESSLSNTNFAVNGVTFRIYVLVNNEFTCHAQFTTVKLDASTATAVSLLGFVAVLLSIFSVHEVGKRRRRTVAQADLLAEEEKVQEQIEFDAVHSSYVTL